MKNFWKTFFTNTTYGHAAVLTLASVSLLTSGCAMGQKFDYRQSNIPLPVSGSAALGLIVVDQRPYILDGDKKPDFVGVIRGGYGNPFKVTTESGRPMAADIAESLQQSLEAKGFKVKLFSGDDLAPNALGDAARISGATRVVLLRIHEWKSDAYMSVSVNYDLALLVYDDSGQLVAENRLADEEDIGGMKMSSESNSATAVEALSRKLGYLFGSDSVVNALAD